MGRGSAHCEESCGEQKKKMEFRRLFPKGTVHGVGGKSSMRSLGSRLRGDRGRRGVTTEALRSKHKSAALGVYQASALKPGGKKGSGPKKGGRLRLGLLPKEKKQIKKRIWIQASSSGKSRASHKAKERRSMKPHDSQAS